MSRGSHLSTAEILAAFREAIDARGGRVMEAFVDGRRLFTRSVLALAEDVRPGDRLKGGVALKATEEELWIHPYLFRQVCRNGAIVAEALQSCYVAELSLYDADEARHVIEQGVERCSAEEAFAQGMEHMRSASLASVDLALMMLPLMARLAPLGATNLPADIIDRFFRDGDRTSFGLVQAITSVARDNVDPDVRWDLEELGGMVAAGVIEPTPSFGAAHVHQLA